MLNEVFLLIKYHFLEALDIVKPQIIEKLLRGRI